MVNAYRSIGELQSALYAHQWAEACSITGRVLAETSFEGRAIVELDRWWRSASSEHFGFSVQAALIDGSPPSCNGVACWNYVSAVGCAAGWHRYGWRSFEGTWQARQFCHVPSIARHGPPLSFCRGMFPLYEVVFGAPPSPATFSPRDACGGGRDWDLLCRRTVHRGPSGRTPGDGQLASDAALRRRLASALASSGHRKWQGPTEAMAELIRQKQLATPSAEDLAVLKTYLSEGQGDDGSNVRERIQGWVAKHEGVSSHPP